MKTLRLGSDAHALGDRRQDPRVPVDGPACLWRPASAARQWARISDVSARGALLQTGSLIPGERIHLEIEGTVAPIELEAVVVRSRRNAEPNSSVAVRFLDDREEAASVH